MAFAVVGRLGLLLALVLPRCCPRAKLGACAHSRNLLIDWPERVGSGVLREVMPLDASTTQSDSSGLSVHAPVQYQAASCPAESIGDDQLDRLLPAWGFRLEVVRRRVTPRLTRSESRSWQDAPAPLEAGDREVSITGGAAIERNLDRLSAQVTGQPQEQNLDLWRQLFDRG